MVEIKSEAIGKTLEADISDMTQALGRNQGLRPKMAAMVTLTERLQRIRHEISELDAALAAMQADIGAHR